MMADQGTVTFSIATVPGLPAAQDYYALRAMGLGRIIELASANWTDYNEHDPGITILEALAYALTDLGFRGNFSMADLLSPPPGIGNAYRYQFQTAAVILTSSAVTEPDFRKMLLDLDHIVNAWVEPAVDFQPLPGLYDLYLQPDPAFFDTATDKEKEALKAQVKDAFVAARNLGQDLNQVQWLSSVPVYLDLSLILLPDARPEDVLGNVLLGLSNWMSPVPQFLSLQERTLQAEGAMARVFEGPVLCHGFLGDEGLTPRVQSLDPEKAIRLVEDMEGVLSVQHLAFSRTPPAKGPAPAPLPPPLAISGETSPAAGKVLYLRPGEIAVLAADLAGSAFTLYLGDYPHQVSIPLLEARLNKLKALQRSSKLACETRDLPIPTGRYRYIYDQIPIRDEFPAHYGLAPGALPPNATAMRKAQARQLNGYLLLFDQMMGNYLAQIARLADLFAWSPVVRQTYFFHGLDTAGQDLAYLLDGFPLPSTQPANSGTPEQSIAEARRLQDFQKAGQRLWESRSEFEDRRTRFLSHVLARLGRSLNTYLSGFSNRTDEQGAMAGIRLRERILANYPALSSERGRGGNYLGGGFSTGSLSGMRKMVENLLGMPVETAKSLALRERLLVTTYKEGAVVSAPDEPVITTRDLSPVDLPVLIQLGQKPENYHEMSTPEGNLTFWIYDENEGLSDPSRVFTFHNSYFTAPDTTVDVAQLVEFFKEYDRQSERVHVLDHLLFRPNPRQDYFGLEIVDPAGRTIMENGIWYPQAALEIILELKGGNQPNYTVTTWEPDAEPQNPLFEFRIEAVQGGKVVPLDSQGTLSYRFSLDPQVSPVNVPATSTAFADYLRQHYAGDWAQSALLGSGIIADFVETAEPPGWSSAGKEQEMLQWGFGVMQSVLKTDYAGQLNDPQALGQQIADDAKQMLPRIDNPARIIQGAQSAFLYLIRCIYQAQNLDPEALGQAVIRDFGPAQKTPPALPPDPSALLTMLGRALGNAWLRGNYPGEYQSAGSLGAALVQDFQLAPPDQEEEKVLQNQAFSLLSRFFLQSMEAGSPPGSGNSRSIFDALLQINGGPASLDQAQLAAAGFAYLREYIRYNWNTSLDDPRALGNSLLHLWEQSLQHGGTLSGKPPENIASLSEFLLVQIISTIFSPDTGSAEQLGQAVIAGFFSTRLAESQFISAHQQQLASVASQLFPWLIRQELAPGALSPANQEAFGLLLNAPPDTAHPDFIVQGDIALDYYSQDIYPILVAAKNERGLGTALLKDLGKGAGLPTTNDKKTALAAVGGFFLSWFAQGLQAQVSQSGSTLTEMAQELLQAGSPPSSPPGGTDPVQYLLKRRFSTALNWLSTNVQPLPMVSVKGKTPSQVDWETLIQDHILDPQPIADLPAGWRDLLTATGQGSLSRYLSLAFPWQVWDNSCLGNAVIALVQDAPVPELPEPPSTSSSAPARPAPTEADQVMYYLYLGWHYDPGYVRLQPAAGFFTYAEVLDAVDGLVALAEAVRQGKARPGSSPGAYRILPRIRPWPTANPALRERPEVQDPYSQIATVLIPDWPGRFQDKGFRKLLEQMLVEESPANVLLNIMWVDKVRMQEFIALYNEWQTSDRDDPVGWNAAGQLIAMFMEHITAQGHFYVRPENG